MRNKDLHLILFLDNARCHLIDFSPYKNVDVMFLKPNITGYVHPLNMGYYATVKARFKSYRKR